MRSRPDRRASTLRRSHQCAEPARCRATRTEGPPSAFQQSSCKAARTAAGVQSWTEPARQQPLSAQKHRCSCTGLPSTSTHRPLSDPSSRQPVRCALQQDDARACHCAQRRDGRSSRWPAVAGDICFEPFTRAAHVFFHASSSITRSTGSGFGCGMVRRCGGHHEHSCCGNERSEMGQLVVMGVFGHGYPSIVSWSLNLP